MIQNDPIYSPAITAKPKACFQGGAAEMLMSRSMLPKTMANISA